MHDMMKHVGYCLMQIKIRAAKKMKKANEAVVNSWLISSRENTIYS
jgi:hypothetical protein